MRLGRLRRRTGGIAARAGATRPQRRHTRRSLRVPSPAWRSSRGSLPRPRAGRTDQRAASSSPTKHGVWETTYASAAMCADVPSWSLAWATACVPGWYYGRVLTLNQPAAASYTTSRQSGTEWRGRLVWANGTSRRMSRHEPRPPDHRRRPSTASHMRPVTSADGLFTRGEGGARGREMAGVAASRASGCGRGLRRQNRRAHPGSVTSNAPTLGPDQGRISSRATNNRHSARREIAGLRGP